MGWKRIATNAHLLLLMAAVLCQPACRPEPGKRAVPLPSEVYIWQRGWKPEIGESIASSKSWVQAYHLLAAEVRFDGSKASILKLKPGVEDLRGCKVGLVIRIFPSAAKTGWDPPAIATVTGLVQELVAEWPTGQVCEVQLDYDCPDSKLADYLRLLKAVQGSVSPLKITCTTLPSWLAQKGFSELAAAVPGYVLQVHSLHLPEPGQRGRASLVDLEEVRQAVARAVALGVPFRVALPTYSCVVEFNAGGKVHEVYAEDVPPALALHGASYEVLDADAYRMEALVAQWRAEASPLMQAVVWYRLPVKGDRLNWPLETLAHIVQGQSLTRGWLAKVETRDGGHGEIVIEQTGDAPDDLPGQVTLRWTGGALSGADGLRGYRVLERKTRKNLRHQIKIREKGQV